MKAWIIQSDQPVSARVKAAAMQTSTGGGAVALHKLWSRRLMEWNITSTKENRAQMEHHQDMLLYHKGVVVFWWDGGINGRVENRLFLGYGNGVDTDFFIPYRFVFAPSLVVSVNYATESAWTLVESTGMVRFVTAPAVGSIIHAEKFVCRFKAYFLLQSEDELYQMADNLKHFESTNITIREFPY